MSSDRLATSGSALKRGAFSSFSIPLVKSSKKEKQSVSKHIRAQSTRSQQYSPPPINQRHFNISGMDYNRSPAAKGRLSCTPTHGKPQVKTPDPDRIAYTQKSSKKLSNQSISNRKFSREENELKEFSKSYSLTDYENLKIEFEKQRKELSKYKYDNSTLVKERDVLLLKVNSLENTRFQLKSLTRTMTEVINSLIFIEKPVPLTDLDYKSELISQIQTLFVHKLKEISTSTSVEFDEEIHMIENRNLKPSTSNTLKFNYKQEDSIEINPIDYSNVPSWITSSERSTDEQNTPKLGSSLADLHPLNPLRNIKPSKIAFFHDENNQELEICDSKLQQNIRSKSQSRSESRQFAFAIYDFAGERAEDLTFSPGEMVEIVKTDNSGWWTGKIGHKIGTFPYNFVQLSN